jgi:hypothetical protein
MKEHVLRYIRKPGNSMPNYAACAEHQRSTLRYNLVPGVLTKAVLYMACYLAEHFGQDIDPASRELYGLAAEATAEVEHYLSLIEQPDLARLTLRDWQNLACLVARACRLPVPLTIQLRPGQF